MRTLKIDGLEVSRICLGGGKMVDMDIETGKSLVRKAMELGINIFDCHHRYGNCEKIVGQFDNIVKMTKISAYRFEERYKLLEASIQKLGKIDILIISDLDNNELYTYGEDMFNEFYRQGIYFNNPMACVMMGITTEDPTLAYRFMNSHPECDIFLVPVYIGSKDMTKFIKDAQDRGKIVFAIKTMCDGLSLKDHTVQECSDFVKSINLDVVVVGTSNLSHLEELVNIYSDGVI